MKWYLTKKNDEEPPPKARKPTTAPTPTTTQNKNKYPPLSLKRRYPLPEDFKFDGDQYMLHGYLISASGTTEKNVPVVLTKLKSWEVDLSLTWRGIWVETESACYYLKDPCHVAVPRVTYFDGDEQNKSSSLLAKDPYLPSQMSLDLILRAKISLLSNIIDIFCEKKGNKSHHYAPLHAKIRVEESHKMLSLDSSLLKLKYKHVKPVLNEEPFDLKLLKQKEVTMFVWKCLRNYHLTLSDNSTFMKSLLALTKEQESQKQHQNEWREIDYQKGALIAEKRGKRESWGEPLPNYDEVRPNRLIELEAGGDDTAAKDPSEKEKEVEEQKKAVEGSSTKILDGGMNHIFVMTEKPELDEGIMIESIMNLSNHLTPKPSQGIKSSDYLKYAVDQSNMEEFLQTYVLTSGVISLECMLLIVSAVSRSSDKAMKSLFKVRSAEDSDNTAGAIIFRFWLSYAISIMEKRRHRFSRTKPQLGEVRTEELIAAEILELIAKYHVIKTPKQILTLKNKYNVDWVNSVQKVREIDLN